MSEGQGTLVILLLAGILIALWPSLLVWAGWGLTVVVGVFRAVFGVGYRSDYWPRG